jgi:hypothetical protein
MTKNKSEITALHQSTFESLRKTNQAGQDYWSARELQVVLGYLKWEKESNHFFHVGKMVSAVRDTTLNSEDEGVGVRWCGPGIQLFSWTGTVVTGALGHLWPAAKQSRVSGKANRGMTCDFSDWVAGALGHWRPLKDYPSPFPPSSVKMSPG